MEKNKIVYYCDKIILFSLYAVVFFLPISKALIEIFVCLSIVCFVIKKVVQRQIIPRTKLNLAILIYLTVCFISIFISSNFKISTRAFIGRTIENIALFFVAVDALNSKQRIKNILYIFFLSSLLLGIDGIYQHFTHKEFIRHRPYYDIPRIHATFSSANDYGCYLSIVITFILACFFDKVGFKKFFRILLVGLFILLFVCLLLTLSHGAWLAFIVSLLFMSIWIRFLGILFLVFIILIIMTRQLYLPFLKKWLANFYSLLNRTGIGIDREQIWRAAWKMIVYKPWLGLGLGTFMFNFRKFVIETYVHGTPYAHNCYLQMTAETGIIGLLSFLSILIIFFYNGIKIINIHERTFSWYALLASLSAILGYSAQMTVDTIFYSLDLGALFWFVLALGIATMKTIELETQIDN